ncbi:MAG: RNA methyltransferase [Trueperaceae bacterium]
MSAPRIVLVSTKESANVGAAARAMLNFGLRDLWLVAPRCRLDHRAYALASHAAEVLDNATVVQSLDEAIADRTTVLGTSARGRAADNFLVLSPRSAARELDAHAAVLFGPEDHGLSNEHLTRCQGQIVIPTLDFSSLNLAQAVLVVAYELGSAQADMADEPAKNLNAVMTPTSEAGPPGLAGLPEGHEPAKRDQLEGFYTQLAHTLVHIGYTDERRLPGILRLYRGLIDRARPSAHDLAALRGMLRQTLWAADQPPENVPGNRRASNEPPLS